MRDDPYPQFIVLTLNIIEDFQPQSYQKNPMSELCSAPLRTIGHYYCMYYYM